MSSDDTFQKKKGVRYVSIPLTKMDNGGYTDRSVKDPVWAENATVGQAVVVSSLDHPEADVRFCHGKTGTIIEHFVRKGVIGYNVSVMGSMIGDNSSGGTGFFFAEDKLTFFRPKDQLLNLSTASDEELVQVKRVLDANATAFGTTNPDFDRTIAEIKAKRPFKFGWRGMCNLPTADGTPLKPEVKKEKIYYFTENTKNWLQLQFTPGDGGFETKAFKLWCLDQEGSKDRSWNENLDLWHALSQDQRTDYFGQVQHKADVQAHELKKRNEQKKAEADAVRKQREEDRAAGVGRGRRAAAAAANDANLSKRRRVS